MNKELTYSEAFKELETITADIENASVSVEELSEKVKRASWLLDYCRSILLKTETEVARALGEATDGNPSEPAAE